MKTSIFIAVCCVIFALSSAAVRAQDTTRVPDTNPDAGGSVDAWVHAGVDEQSAQQPQPPRQPNKRQQTSYSHWAFQSANQPSATRFQPEQAPSLLAQPGKSDNPSTLFNPLTRSETPPPDILRHGQDTPFGISPIAGTNDPRNPQSAAVRGLLQNLNSESETQVQSFKSKKPVPSPYPGNSGFSTTLREKKVEPTEKTSFPSPFSKPAGYSSNPLHSKSQQHTSPKSVDRSKPASLLGSQAAKQN